MRKFISVFFALALSLLLCGNVFAIVDGFGATGLTGGTTGKLDAIDITLDDIDDGDTAVVHSAGVVYLYYYDDDNATTEASPDYIAPDENNGVGYTGDGRWVLNGIYPATLQLPNGTSINELSTDGVMAGNSDDAVPTEQAVVEYIPQIIPTLIPGGVIARTKMTFSSTTTITLTAAAYHHSGTLEQIVYWDSTLTFILGSGGSNAASDDLDNGAVEWQYIYIDDSALSGTAVTAARILNDPTAPAFDATDHAWMNNHDRCIGAVYINASNEVVEFFQSGDFVFFADDGAARTTADLDNGWEDVTLTIPGFARHAQVVMWSYWVDGAALLKWRTNGQTGATGHAVTYSTATATHGLCALTVVTDSSQKIEVTHNTDNGNTAGVATVGWYLPIGM